MGVPSISIFVRHGEDCGHKADRFYKRCDCKKWLEWFHAGAQHRVSAKTRSWAIAEEVKRVKEEQYRNGLPAAAEAPVTPISPKGGRTTVAVAVQTFLDAKKTERAGIAVLGKYRTELPRLEAFLSKRSVFYPGDITYAHLVAYRATWDKLYPSPLTQQKVQERMKSFLREACKENLADLLKLKPPKVKASDRPGPQPFSDDDIERLLAQVPVTFSGQLTRLRITALIHLMVSTGLACVDAVKLEKKNFETGWLDVRRHKTGKRVQQKLNPTLLKELRTVTNGNPQYVFWDGEVKLPSLTGLFQKQLRRLMKDTKDAKGESLYTHGDLSHRFRDTYVEFLFRNGCSITQVAEAIGDSEAIVDKHYKALTDAVRDRLEKLPQRSFEARP
jgi:integrase/recombinase XerD